MKTVQDHRGSFRVKESRTSGDEVRCSACHRFLPVQAFQRNTGDYLHTWCNACNSAAKVARRKLNSVVPERSVHEAVLAHKRKGVTDIPADIVRQGTCEVCQEHTEKRVIDHDHASNKFRGLLCHRCNLGLGMFRDDIARLTQAAQYLDEKMAA